MYSGKLSAMHVTTQCSVYAQSQKFSLTPCCGAWLFTHQQFHHSLMKEIVASAVSLRGKPQEPTQSHLWLGVQKPKLPTNSSGGVSPLVVYPHKDHQGQQLFVGQTLITVWTVMKKLPLWHQIQSHWSTKAFIFSFVLDASTAEGAEGRGGNGRKITGFRTSRQRERELDRDNGGDKNGTMTQGDRQEWTKNGNMIRMMDVEHTHTHTHTHTN